MKERLEPLAKILGILDILKKMCIRDRHNIITLISSHIFLLKNIKEFPQKKEEKANPFTFSSFGY